MGRPKRTAELNIGVPPHRIDVDLKNLMDDLAFWRESGEMDLIEQVARLHHRSVAIHPFLNGNGRWSRLLANIFLKQSGKQADDMAGTDGWKCEHHSR